MSSEFKTAKEFVSFIRENIDKIDDGKEIVANFLSENKYIHRLDSNDNLELSVYRVSDDESRVKNGQLMLSMWYDNPYTDYYKNAGFKETDQELSMIEYEDGDTDDIALDTYCEMLETFEVHDIYNVNIQ